MRCKICDAKLKMRMEFDWGNCLRCRREFRAASFVQYAGDVSARVEKLIQELEDRIPSLFDPNQPMCPGNGDCDCIKVCKKLTDPLEVTMVRSKEASTGHTNIVEDHCQSTVPSV